MNLDFKNLFTYVSQNYDHFLTFVLYSLVSSFIKTLNTARTIEGIYLANFALKAIMFQLVQI